MKATALFIYKKACTQLGLTVYTRRVGKKQYMFIPHTISGFFLTPKHKNLYPHIPAALLAQSPTLFYLVYLKG